MQQGFLHQTKPLCSCTSSCFSSLPLLRWLFALLLLEQLKFLWPGKGAIAGVHELPQVVPRGGRTPWLMGSGLVIPSARALQSSYLVTAHIAKWERNIRQHRQTEGKKTDELELEADISKKQVWKTSEDNYPQTQIITVPLNWIIHTILK